MGGKRKFRNLFCNKLVKTIFLFKFLKKYKKLGFIKQIKFKIY
jgi:hypothetical protein